MTKWITRFCFGFNATSLCSAGLCGAGPWPAHLILLLLTTLPLHARPLSLVVGRGELMQYTNETSKSPPPNRKSPTSWSSPRTK